MEPPRPPEEPASLSFLRERADSLPAAPPAAPQPGEPAQGPPPAAAAGDRNSRAGKPRALTTDETDQLPAAPEPAAPAAAGAPEPAPADQGRSQSQNAALLTADALEQAAALLEAAGEPLPALAEALPAEVESGNVEYKLTLANADDERVQHLITQMLWRLNEGGHEARYMLGVTDDGRPVGLAEAFLVRSVAVLLRMAAALDATVAVEETHRGTETGRIAEVSVARNPATLAEGREDVRVAVIGNVDSGKSTLIGVLTKGGLDNGRGLARMHVFRHRHEVENGRTSSITQQVLGFDQAGQVANYGGGAAVRALSTAEVVQSAHKLLTFVDLAGHERYLKTTVFGLTGQAPDYAMLLLGANMGVQRMTKEHLGICLALKVPIFVVVTKIDLAPAHIRKNTVKQLARILKSPGARKLPYVVRSVADVLSAAAGAAAGRVVPIFLVSNVTGQSLDLLKMYLNLLPPRREWAVEREKPAEFHIDEAFVVPGVGTVVAGTMFRGRVRAGAPLLLGPDGTGEFKPVTVKSVHTNRVPVDEVAAGQSASFAIKLPKNEKLRRQNVRKGMVLLAPELEPAAVRDFQAEVLVLHHPTTIHENYQPVVHIGTVRQSARIVAMSQPLIRTGDRAICTFQFVYHPEYIYPGATLLFREGRTKGVGRITSVERLTPDAAGEAGGGV